MIENGDRVMVCVSGGKDSFSLLDILIELRERAPIDFAIVAVNLDQKQPGFPAEVLPGYLAGLGVEFRIVEQDTYSVVKRLVPEGKTMCSLCSRLRRGALYRVASELGATKIALGHHRDDMVATLFMNMFFGGRLKAMPPKLVSDDGRHVVIRPLAYVAERDLARWAAEREFPIIPCNLCGSQQNLQRVRIGEMLRAWERDDPGRIDRIFDAMARVVPSHLMDRKLFPFATLAPTGIADADGDRAFDADRTSADATPPATDRSGPIAAASGSASSPRRRRGETRSRETNRRRRLRRCRPRRLRVVLQHRRRGLELQPLADRAEPVDVRLRALAVAAGAAAAGADDRRRGAAGDRRRRLRRRARRRRRRRHGAARRPRHRDRSLAVRRSVLVRRLRRLAPPVRLRLLYGGRSGGRDGAAANYDPWFDSYWYDREVAVLIRDKRSGDPLYEARAAERRPDDAASRQSCRRSSSRR